MTEQLLEQVAPVDPADPVRLKWREVVASIAWSTEAICHEGQPFCTEDLEPFLGRPDITEAWSDQWSEGNIRKDSSCGHYFLESFLKGWHTSKLAAPV